jgi:hypothetical protein
MAARHHGNVRPLDPIADAQAMQLARPELKACLSSRQYALTLVLRRMRRRILESLIKCRANKAEGVVGQGGTLILSVRCRMTRLVSVFLLRQKQVTNRKTGDRQDDYLDHSWLIGDRPVDPFSSPLFFWDLSKLPHCRWYVRNSRFGVGERIGDIARIETGNSLVLVAHFGRKPSICIAPKRTH